MMLCKLFASDLDGTLLGNPAAPRAFRENWERIPAERRPLLCYNSGRLLKDTLTTVTKSGLPESDYVISGVGTTIFDVEKNETLRAFNDSLAVDWDLAKVNSVLSSRQDITKQPEQYQHPFKSSWYWYKATTEQMDELEAQLEAAGLEVSIIYSSSRDLDIVPKFANKGNSLQWLMDHIGIAPEETIVAGDTGNDSSMFLIQGVRGIVVENAQPELLQATVVLPTYVSRKPFAEGVLEGLKHYGVIDEIALVEGRIVASQHFDPEISRLFEPSQFQLLSSDELSLVELAYEKALEALHRNVTPLGFSACSIEDNQFHDMDQNYGSVWGRDGGITIINTLGLQDEAIRNCQRQTLVSLLSNLSASGQIPTYLRLEDETPEYSGVGGICAIDSGLWVIIAFEQFVRATRDFDFLREWMHTLQRSMDWLSAHDGNNDALLEIPEAGDWTDLFGRSYNVLYDEVLWYRANLCFGRMNELVGDYQKATDYLSWAQTIKEAILRKFWPTTACDWNNRTFGDQQYTLGNTHYLLAEISPFAFDWRCDVYGNLLAALFHVLDLDRAKIVFRYLWGVGVNDPWPVANLYPPVDPGESDWRPYYLVNLLNLPDHYHNGGIWPFIGAEWVRFINRLGLRDIAQRELYRLALANQSGTAQEWEFNEWLHGFTGKPMGKCFQAWSASGFIHACHDLRMQPVSIYEE